MPETVKLSVLIHHNDNNMEVYLTRPIVIDHQYFLYLFSILQSLWDRRVGKAGEKNRNKIQRSEEL